MGCPICGEKPSKCSHTFDEMKNAERVAEQYTDELEELQEELATLKREVRLLHERSAGVPEYYAQWDVVKRLMKGGE